MNNLIGSSAMFLMISAVFLTGCKNNQKSDVKKTNTKETTQPSNDDMVKKGEYIVTTTGCNDCHSPKEMGPQGPSVIEATMLSGFQANNPVIQADPEIIKKGFILFYPDLTSASGPWGVSFAANITSDQTGIGNWTEENFKRALKEGKYKGLEGSRTLLPPMPWANFTNMKDEDIAAIFAFLKSTKPVSNIVPAAIISEESGSGNK